MSYPARKDFRAALRLAHSASREAATLDNLFRHVRPGYALWHLCVVRKRPVHLDELADALVTGHVITTLDPDQLRKATRRLADYHVTSGKLRRIGPDHYTNR
jgi:hypothetical protein